MQVPLMKEKEEQFLNEQANEIKFSCRFCVTEDEKTQRVMLWIKECSITYRLWWYESH